jgi:hypothetical protein
VLNEHGRGLQVDAQIASEVTRLLPAELQKGGTVTELAAQMRGSIEAILAAQMEVRARTAGTPHATCHICHIHGATNACHMTPHCRMLQSQRTMRTTAL